MVYEVPLERGHWLAEYPAAREKISDGYTRPGVHADSHRNDGRSDPQHAHLMRFPDESHTGRLRNINEIVAPKYPSASYR